MVWVGCRKWYFKITPCQEFIMGRWGLGIMAGSNLWASEPPGRGSKINLPTPWPAPIQKVWGGSWESIFHRSFLWRHRSSDGKRQLELGAPSGTASVPRTQSASSFPVLTLGFPPTAPLPTSLDVKSLTEAAAPGKWPLAPAPDLPNQKLGVGGGNLFRRSPARPEAGSSWRTNENKKVAWG